MRRECPVHLGDKAELSADGAGLRVTILLDREAVAYFKKLAAETGVAYQVLINLYLKECARLKKRLSFDVETMGRPARRKAA